MTVSYRPTATRAPRTARRFAPLVCQRPGPDDGHDPAGTVSARSSHAAVPHGVDHGFAIAAREVTVAEFRRFRSDYTPGQLCPDR